MPRNRQHIPRDERAADLLQAATAVFVAKGFTATTMADISEAAGVARANIYWYYPSKDDIFAAVMNELYSTEIARVMDGSATLDARSRLTSLLKQLYPYRALHLEMHTRIKQSAGVRSAHDKFMSQIRQLVYEVVDQAGADIDRQMLSDVVLAVFEGARSPTETRPANELIPFILESALHRPGRTGRSRR